MNVVDTQIAYILHSRAYRESSSILEVFTRDHGRFSLMAKGCRGVRSKIAGNLQLFSPLLISWQGRGHMPYLKAVERADLKAPVLQNKALLCAMYVNELLMYLLHKHDVHEAIFERYHRCLYALEKEKNIEITLRQFEISLLELLGFGLNFIAEADSGEPIVAESSYLYHPEHGPVKCAVYDHGRLPLISGACLLALSAERYQLIVESSQYLAEVKRLMRFIISHHLGDRKLKSRELFRPVGSQQ